MPLISAADLTTFSTNLLKAAGVPAPAAHIVSHSLVGANLRGYDSHGVMRLPFYIGAIKSGEVQPAAELVVERETPAALVCDGGWGLGQVLSHQLMTRLIAKAEVTGIACGALRRAAHIGRLGEYAEFAAERSLASMILANGHGSGQRVAPVGGKRGRLGTNPLCIGVPGGAEGPFILDFGTSATAEGKVRVKKIAGETVPLGWILDADGRPTTDPNQLYADPPGSILPMGGDQAYKGFGLAYMIEMLCGGLSGGQCAFPNAPPPKGNAALFFVFAPDLFAGQAHLAREVAQLEQFVRGVPLRDGVERITLPGDPERAVLADRTAHGIPIDAGNWSALQNLASELHIS